VSPIKKELKSGMKKAILQNSAVYFSLSGKNKRVMPGSMFENNH
jgi:hypothetical protein